MREVLHHYETEPFTVVEKYFFVGTDGAILQTLKTDKNLFEL